MRIKFGIYFKYTRVWLLESRRECKQYFQNYSIQGNKGALILKVIIENE